MKKTILISLFWLLCLFAKAQQDAQYSQYMFNGIYINPAYSGYKQELNIHSFYRNQWVGVKGSPKSMSLALDASLNNANVGLAFLLGADRLGAQSSLSFYANYAYRVRLGNDEDTRLAFGVGGGLIQHGLDGNQLISTEINDSFVPVGYKTSLLPDARLGVFFSTNKFYFGASADNLLAQYMSKQGNDEAYYPTPKPHYYLTAGVLLPVNEVIQFKPSFLLKDDRGGPTSLDLSAFVLISDKIWLGGSYRTAVKVYDKSYLQKDLMLKSAIVGMTEFYVSPKLRIGYAYDYSLTKISSYTGASHEISVGFYFSKKEVRMYSPRFF